MLGNDLPRVGQGQDRRCDRRAYLCCAAVRALIAPPVQRREYPYHIALLAKACEIAGQVEEALSLLDDALQIAERIGERWFASELYRHKGQLMLRQGNSEAAEELYRQALAIARKQEAKLWELRAAVSLARLRRDQGRRSEAHDLLAPVYGWFTEGFDTQDLKARRHCSTSGERTARRVEHCIELPVRRE